MLETGNLINGQKYKDLSKQMMVINIRLKEIQDTLINSHSSLSDGISRIIFDLNEVLVDEFAQYQTVSLQNTIEALGDIHNGKLCIDVYNALQKSERKTPLDNILRGLLTPKGIHRVKRLALEKARQEFETFQKDIEILLLLTVKKRNVKSQFKKTERLKVIKDHLEEKINFFLR